MKSQKKTQRRASRRPTPAPSRPPGVAKAVKSKSGGTERWPKEAVRSGEFIQLPKVLTKRLKDFKIQPKHLWLLLFLQSDRFRDRAPRFYWQEIADACGKSMHTVRKWAYELEQAGLLRIKRKRSLDDGQVRRTGHRNERNQFFLEPFEARVREVQRNYDKERQARRKPSS